MKRKTAYMGVFLAFALILSYVESLIPFYFGVPGIKLGLTNLIIVILLYELGVKEALCISILRIILAGFLFGNMFSILYSLAGGLCSFCMMCLLKKCGLFHIVTVSVCGGITHNMAQLALASLIVENYGVFFYAPALLLSGVLTGFLIGVLAAEIEKRVERFFRETVRK